MYETVRDSTTKKPSKLGTGRQRAISNALHFINWHRFTLDVWPINKLVTTHTARVPVILACYSVCFLQVLRLRFDAPTRDIYLYCILQYL